MFVVGGDAFDLVAFHQNGSGDGVVEDLHPPPSPPTVMGRSLTVAARIGEEVVGGFAPDEGVVDAGVGFAVFDGRGEAVVGFHELDEFVEEAVDDLARRGGGVVGGFVHAADGAGETGDGAAAAEAVAFDEGDFAALADGGGGGGDTGGAAADDEDVGGEVEGGAVIGGVHIGLHELQD